MTIMKFMGAALVLTMLGGAAASASTISAPQPQQTATVPQNDTTTVPMLAANMPRTPSVPAARPLDQQPKTLPLANFGQWDEAASEN